jgi:hypothetical protein
VPRTRVLSRPRRCASSGFVALSAGGAQLLAGERHRLVLVEVAAFADAGDERSQVPIGEADACSMLRRRWVPFDRTAACWCWPQEGAIIFLLAAAEISAPRRQARRLTRPFSPGVCRSRGGFGGEARRSQTVRRVASDAYPNPVPAG